MKILLRARARSRVVLVLAACTFAGSLVLTACSSGGATGHHNSHGSSSATAQITKDWETFFSGKSTATAKINVLQNGSQFASYIKSQENTSLAKSTTVKVTKVVVASSKTSAKVTYTVYLGGTPELSGSIGTAVYQNKTWKVSDTSFCALLSLEQAASKVKACAGK